ncbi:MAG: hypothetical protein ABIL58_05890 [Pseudomonadota bacterium]
MRNRLFAVVVALFVFTLVSACGGGYYRVKDPVSDKTYYTTDVDEEKGGAIKLKDANTGSTVTLQNSEVTKIKKEEFKANTKKE